MRPHDAPDCACRDCVVHDCPEMVEDLERLLVRPYEPWMAPHIREAKEDSDRMLAKYGPIVRAMGEQAGEWAETCLADAMKGGRS